MRAAFLLLAASLGGCATAQTAAPPAPAPSWAESLAAAVSGPCVAYVSASQAERVIPEPGPEGGVQVLALGDDPAEPLCLAIVQGAGAVEAGRAAARLLMAPGAGFTLADPASPPEGELFWLTSDWLTVQVDLAPSEGVETAALLVMPAPMAPPDPNAPSEEEIAAAEALSLEEAFTAAIFEVAPHFIDGPEEDEAADRRIRALGAGSLADVFVMRMSTDQRMVGVAVVSDETLQVIAMGSQAAAASEAALGRLRSAGWSFSGFQTSGGGVLMRCFTAPDDQERVCVSDAVRLEAQTVTVAEVSLTPR